MAGQEDTVPVTLPVELVDASIKSDDDLDSITA